MVGETQAKPFARNTEELITMFREKEAAAKQKALEAKKMIAELEIDLATHSAEEMAWSAARYELEHLGEQAGPKKRRRGKSIEEEEEEEEESD